MEQFITTIAENAALITLVGLGWCALSFAAALVLGKAIRRGTGDDEGIIHPSDE